MEHYSIVKTNDTNKDVDEKDAQPSEKMVNDETAWRLIEEAEAYRDLGLYEEAEVELRAAVTAGGHPGNVAQERLMALLMGERRFQETADLGSDLIARGKFFYVAIIDTMLALNFLGRIAEAREVLRLVEKCGHRLEDDAYQMACFASRLGEYREALGWLAKEFRRSTEYYARAFADTDLAPFWDWFGTYKPTLEEAHLIVETRFKDVCATALDKNAPIALTADDVDHLPERQRALFRYDREAGLFLPHPTAIAHDPDAMTELVRTHEANLERVAASIREAHQVAGKIVVEEQARYAAEQIAWGNHLGARYHILWGRRYGLALLRSFEEPGLKPMEPFLYELLEATAADHGFCERMAAIEDCAGSDPVRARELIDETPEALHATGLFRLRAASVLMAEGRHEEALPLWAALRRQWPLDAAGFGNAVDCLMQLGRKEEARKVLEEAPACYRRFGLYWAQLAEIEDTAPTLRVRPANLFRGQPDLGGLLLTASEYEASVREREAIDSKVPSEAPALPQITAQDLKALIRSLPERKLTLGIVYVEDIYETIAGDGYYSYPERAFLSFQTAERCAEWITRKSAEKSSCGYRAVAKPVEVTLNHEGGFQTPSASRIELALDLMNKGSTDWNQVLAHCTGGSAVEPDFENETSTNL